jgi:hypothetical protein
MGTPNPERSIRSLAFTRNPNTLRVELHGSTELVGDDLDVVNSFEHHRL